MMIERVNTVNLLLKGLNVTSETSDNMLKTATQSGCR